MTIQEKVRAVGGRGRGRGMGRKGHEVVGWDARGLGAVQWRRGEKKCRCTCTLYIGVARETVIMEHSTVR